MFIIENQKLYIGIDMGTEYTQISYYDETLFEPCSISEKDGEELYLIPTVLAATKENGQWYFGADALQIGEEKKIPVIADFVSRIETGEAIVYYDREWGAADILKRFLRKCLHLVTVKFPAGTIQKLVITVEEKSDALTAALTQALHELGLEDERFAVITHQESYVYYALRQKKELWLNDVGLFDFSRRGLFFYRIFMNRRTSPVTVGIEKKDFTELLSYQMLMDSKNDGEMAYIFDGITKNALHKKIVSTIYVTGHGFEGSWHKSVLEGLCVGRRVFFGQNLYAIGACYGAKELAGEGKLSDYILLSEEMVLVDISMKIFTDTKFAPFYFVKAGTLWKDAEQTIEIIPDNESELELEVYDVMTQEKKTFFLHIDQIDGRPGRTTILEAGLKFLDPKTCVVQVKDKGFGNLFLSTNRIWEKEIHL